MSHFHHIVRRPGLYPIVVLSTLAFDDSDAQPCDCETGDAEVFHDHCQSDDTSDECPCADCQADRNVRFARWRAEQEKAGVHVQ